MSDVGLCQPYESSVVVHRTVKPFNPNDDGFYSGYIAAVCDSSTHILFSIPEGATLGQACDVVGKWLDGHPEEWNKPAQQLVIKALKEAFPLEKNSAKKK